MDVNITLVTDMALCEWINADAYPVEAALRCTQSLVYLLRVGLDRNFSASLELSDAATHHMSPLRTEPFAGDTMARCIQHALHSSGYDECAVTYKDGTFTARRAGIRRAARQPSLTASCAWKAMSSRTCSATTTCFPR